MDMPLGIRLPPCAPVRHVADAVRKAEEMGFEQAYLPDSQLLWRDPFMAAHAAFLGTERIRIATAVSNLVTRHPSVLASVTRTLGEESNSRFDLGLGIGNSAVQPVGLKPSKQLEFAAGIKMVRGLLSGQEVEFSGGVRGKLRDPSPCPILVAATGPRNLALAGQLADGVVLLSGSSVAGIQAARDQVAVGAQEAGRLVDDLRIIVSAFARVTDDIERDARDLKPVCVTIAQGGGRAALEAVGIDVDVPRRITSVYPDLLHAEDWAEAVRVASHWISDEDAVRFARHFCLFGTLAEIKAQIEAAQLAGATSIMLQHVGSYDLPMELMESISPLNSEPS